MKETKLSAQIKAQKLTTYECFCYACKKPYLTEHPANCPKCGKEPSSVNMWREGNFVGYGVKEDKNAN